MSDLIDRQALLRQIDIDSDGEPGYYGDTWKFIDTIKNLPSATNNNVGTELGTNLASLGTDCISRQAAIDALDEYFVRIGELKRRGLNKGEKAISLDTVGVIKTLPSAQPEQCEDAVSRLEIVRNLHKYFKEGFEQDKWWNSGHVIHAIMDAPSVTPKQRTGKWIRLDMHAHLADHKCTACGQECYVPTCMGEPMYAYCPNCGADMRGEQDG